MKKRAELDLMVWTLIKEQKVSSGTPAGYASSRCPTQELATGPCSTTRISVNRKEYFGPNPTGEGAGL
jgi:hypothetical protein